MVAQDVRARSIQKNAIFLTLRSMNNIGMNSISHLVNVVKKQAFLLLLVGLLLPGPGRAQDNSYNAYHFARETLFLLKNHDQLLPLGGLDTLRVGVFFMQNAEPTVFLETLRKYTPHITGEALPMLMGTPKAKAWVKAREGTYDIHVLFLRDDVFQGEPLPYMYRRATIQALQEAAPTITVLAEPKQGLQEMPVLAEAEALLTTTDTYWGQSLAAQVIFGGSPIDNRLPIALADQFPVGSGLALGASRLGYTPPEATGMRAQLLRDSIAHLVQLGLDSMAYPGAQVLVAHRGKIVYHEAFGHHTYEQLRPVQTDDIYDLASVTKVSSALPALMQWYGQGRFELDAPLTRYFDGFRRRSNKDELTYRQMLAHNARLRPWIPYWQGTLRGHGRYPWRRRWNPTRINDRRFRWNTFEAEPSEKYSIRITDSLWLHRDFKEKIYKAIRKSPLNEEPGYVYSGLLFYLLPEIVQDMAGKNFEEYLKETFYRPLGAHTITYNPLRYYDETRIVPTEQDTFFRMQLLHGTVHDEGAAMMGGVSANAGLFASANDLAKLFQMYMNYGQYGNRQLIASRAVEEFTRCQYCEEDNRRGLGFDKPMIEYDSTASYIAEAASARSFGHSGYTGTFVWADPEEELILIFMSNRVHPTRLNRKLYTLGIRPRLHAALYEATGE